MWLVELAKAAPLTAFILVCATYYTLKWLICAPSKIIKARAEARCVHSWELLRSGDVVENMNQINERRVGSYSLYRCEKCGASRDYR